MEELEVHTRPAKRQEKHRAPGEHIPDMLTETSYTGEDIWGRGLLEAFTPPVLLEPMCCTTLN